MINNTAQPRYVKLFEHHYGSIVYLLWYTATETADKGADIAARALPILAPLPNAISIFYISQTVLDFTVWQAFAFAGAIECSLFALTEITLHMWDGKRDNEKYNGPFRVMVWVTGVVILIIIAMVVGLEIAGGGHWVLGLLPLISGASAVALAYRRWHARNKGIDNFQLQLQKVISDKEKVKQEKQKILSTLETMQQEKGKLSTENSKLQSENLRLKNAMETMQQKIEELQSKQKPNRQSGNADERRREVLQLASNGIVSNGEIAEQLSITPSTISKDMKWLRDNKYLTDKNNVTKSGYDWLGIPQHEPAEPYTNGVHA